MRSIVKSFIITGFCILINMSTSFHAFAVDPTFGLFAVAKGDVSIIDAKSVSRKANVGSKVIAGESIQTGPDSRAKVVMADRNVIVISPDTQMVIAKYEHDGKGKKEVALDLMKGKIRNNVEQKYDEEKNTFKVRTPTAVVGVRGTQFITGYDTNTKVTDVVTLRGVVTMMARSSSGGPTGPAVQIRRGESTKLSPGASTPEAPKPVSKDDLKKMKVGSHAESAAPVALGKGNSEASPQNGPTQNNLSANKMLDANDLKGVNEAGAIRMPATSGSGAKTDDSGPKAPPPQNLGGGSSNPILDSLIGNKLNKGTIVVTPK
jgi:hypothetical protein